MNQQRCSSMVRKPVLPSDVPVFPHCFAGSLSSLSTLLPVFLWDIKHFWTLAVFLFVQSVVATSMITPITKDTFNVQPSALYFLLLFQIMMKAGTILFYQARSRVGRCVEPPVVRCSGHSQPHMRCPPECEKPKHDNWSGRKTKKERCGSGFRMRLRQRYWQSPMYSMKVSRW